VLVDVVGDEQGSGAAGPDRSKCLCTRGRWVPYALVRFRRTMASMKYSYILASIYYITLRYAEQSPPCFHNRARHLLQRGAASHAARGLIRLGEAEARRHVSTWLQGLAATAWSAAWVEASAK
jgi:hypothetical protein